MNSGEKIGDTTLVFMLIIAGFYDLIQFLISFIPVLGEILSMLISIFAFMTFYVWFKMYGMNFMTPKRAATMGGGFLIELIPVVDMLPAWTCAVVILVGTTKVKELVAKSGVANTTLKLAGKLPSARERMPTVPIVDKYYDRVSGQNRAPLQNSRVNNNVVSVDSTRKNLPVENEYVKKTT